MYHGCLWLEDADISVTGAPLSAMEARLLYSVSVISLRLPGGWGLLEWSFVRLHLLTHDQLCTHLNDLDTAVLWVGPRDIDINMG